MTKTSGGHQGLVQTLDQDVFGQIDANKDHFAHPRLTRRPSRAQITAHELVHPLENHFALGALHVQHAFVTQHARPIDLHDGTQKVLQLGRIERSGGTVDEAFHIVIVVMVVAVIVLVGRV